MFWGAVGVAVEFGVSDLIIGLTIVALGTSLQNFYNCNLQHEKGEHDMILLLEMLLDQICSTFCLVIGIAVVIAPMNNVPLKF